jgi:hypothetical protein
MAGIGCLWQLAQRPGGSWQLAVWYGAACAAASVSWVALRRLDVVAAARKAGPDLLLRRAHLRSGFVALGAGVAFAFVGRAVFGLTGRAYGEPDAGYAAGILVALCILCPAVCFSVGATHAAARRCKAPELERLRRAGGRLAPWEQPAPGGLLIRHWRGQYNLPRTFWLHVIGLNVAIDLFSVAAGLVSTHLDVGLSALLAFGIMLLYPPILVWQQVGLWRSSTRYARFHGRRTAALPAKGFVVFCSAFFLHHYAAEAPAQARELTNILRGDPEWTSFSAIVDGSGRTVTIRGNLQSGCHWEFDRVLASAPEATALLIDSPGGRLAEGERIAAAVRRRHLDTVAIGDCESAATVVFLAGAHRSLGPRGTLGFHSPSLPEASATSLLELAMELQLSLDMHAAGVSEPFIRRTLNTPGSDMWYPTRPVLRAAGVLTQD